MIKIDCQRKKKTKQERLRCFADKGKAEEADGQLRVAVAVAAIPCLYPMPSYDTVVAC
jgi:hypothetical protein